MDILEELEGARKQFLDRKMLAAALVCEAASATIEIQATELKAFAAENESLRSIVAELRRNQMKASSKN